MTTLLVIIWLICGLIAVWRDYHGCLKNWYEQFNESYWDFHRRQGESAISIIIWGSPLIILGGLFSLLLVEYDNNVKPVWYFTTKNK